MLQNRSVRLLIQIVVLHGQITIAVFTVAAQMGLKLVIDAKAGHRRSQAICCFEGSRFKKMNSSDSAILEKIERPGPMLLGELQPCGGGDTIPLTRSKLLVGRRSHCDICLKFSNVSSQHCELELKDGYWHIRDLGSRNGIKVNGLQVETKCILPGDEVMIAKMVFKIDYAVDPDAPVPEDDSPFAISLMEKAGLATRPQSRMPKPTENATKSKPAKSSSAPRQDPRDLFLMEWFPE